MNQDEEEDRMRERSRKIVDELRSVAGKLYTDSKCSINYATCVSYAMRIVEISWGSKKS